MNKKIVLVTGASRGLGLALTKALHEYEFKVIATARNLADLDNVTAYQKIQLDISKQTSIDNSVAQIDKVDVIINNAAISVSGTIEAIPIEQASTVFNSNVMGCMRMMQAFTPMMRKNGSGLFVNISSGTALGAPPLQGIYAASKAALDRISEAFRVEVKGFGIRVMQIHSTGIATEMRATQKLFSNAHYADLTSRIQQMEGRMTGVSPTDLATVIAQLIAKQPEVEFISAKQIASLVRHLQT